MTFVLGGAVALWIGGAGGRGGTRSGRVHDAVLVISVSVLGIPVCLLDFLPKTDFLDSLEIFRLDIGQIIWLNLVKNAFATSQLAFLSTIASHFTTFWLGRAQKSKF